MTILSASWNNFHWSKIITEHWSRFFFFSKFGNCTGMFIKWFFLEGRKLALSFEAKFIETSAGIQHNVDELLVGVLKQVRLRGEQASMSTSKSKKCEDDEEHQRSRNLPSPLRTLQAARDILTRACLSSNKKRPMDCENLHILWTNKY